MDNQIFWIASYPKSGNTLLRSIIISLFFTKDGLFSLKLAKYIQQFDTTNHIQNNKIIFGNDFKEINKLEILYKYLNELQSKKALRFNQDFIFLKTHSGLFKIGNFPFTTMENTRGVIYVVRDPRDVCISWSKHSNITVDNSINFMMDDLAVLKWKEGKNKKEIFTNHERPKTLLSSWDKNVISWVNIKSNWNIPMLVIKFEDLVYNKEKVVVNIIKFFEEKYKFSFENKDEKIKNILKSTDFNLLKKEEKDQGFIESTGNNNFFSVGKKNQWKNILNKEQLKKIERKFGKTMKSFNYKLNVEI